MVKLGISEMVEIEGAPSSIKSYFLTHIYIYMYMCVYSYVIIYFYVDILLRVILNIQSPDFATRFEGDFQKIFPH